MGVAAALFPETHSTISLAFVDTREQLNVPIFFSPGFQLGQLLFCGFRPQLISPRTGMFGFVGLLAEIGFLDDTFLLHHHSFGCMSDKNWVFVVDGRHF